HEWERIKRPWPLDQIRILKAEGPLGGDEYVMNCEIVTAGAAQAGRIPGIENFTLSEPHKAGTRFRNAGGIHVRSAVVDDVATDPRPFAMLTAAGEGETAAYTIAAAHRYCLTSGGRGRCGGDVDI